MWVQFILRFFLFGFIVFMFSMNAKAQVITDTLTQEEAEDLRDRLDKQLKRSNRNLRFQFLPIIYFTPETKLALGASGIFSFKFDVNDSTLLRSQITPSFVYTFNKQMLAQVGYNLNINRNWLLKGRLGYFIYPYFFSGTGNDHDGKYKEWYDAEFPIVSLKLFRKVYKNSVSIGMLYDFQRTNISSISDSLLKENSVNGAQGSTQSALGGSIVYDNRDFKLSSTSGWYGNVSLQFTDENLGASYQDQTIIFDLRKYISVSSKKDVLALQVYSETHQGDVPFNLMSMLGGSRLMRGYQQGVYRDRQMMVWQAEFRSRLLFKYFGFVLFGNYGAIGDKLEDLNNNYRYTYGVGLRFTPIPKDRYFIRFDYGRGKDTQGFYFAVGEAF